MAPLVILSICYDQINMVRNFQYKFVFYDHCWSPSEDTLDCRDTGTPGKDAVDITLHNVAMHFVVVRYFGFVVVVGVFS